MERARAQQYRKLFEESNDAVFLHTSTGKIFDVNSLACQILGYSREKLLSMNMSDLIPPNSEIAAKEILSTVNEEGVALFTVKFLKSDATEFDVSMSSSVVDRENDIIQEIVRDVTEILKYRDRLKAIHTHATWLSSAVNLSEVAAATNHAIEDTLGFHQGGFAIVEGDHLRFIPLMNFDQSGEDLDLPLDGKGVTVQAVRQGKSFLIRDTLKDEDFWIPENPQYVPLSALIVPVKLNGAVVAVLNVESLSADTFTLQDQELLEILALHVSSAIGRLRKLEELEDLVQEKTKELLEAEQIVTAGKIAASVGHDLKSPLQVIKNAVYLMKKTPDDSEAMISMIEDSVERANQMIEEFRLKTRDSPVKLVNTDLTELIDKTIKEIGLTFNVKLVNKTSKIHNAVSYTHLRAHET